MSDVIDKVIGKRVVVALESAIESARTLDMALSLASTMGSELNALFVEDVNLLRLAALPFAMEIGGASAAARPFEYAVLERAFKAEAARIKQWLARSAGDRKVRWTLTVRRGQLLEEICNSGQEADVLILGARTASVPVMRASIAPKVSSTPSNILIVFDCSAAAFRALTAALAFAYGQHGLILLVCNEQGEELESCRQQAQAWLNERAASARILGPDVALTNLSSVARRYGVVSIFAPYDRLEASSSILARLALQVQCPLVLMK